jgi:hypothetical protein
MINNKFSNFKCHVIIKRTQKEHGYDIKNYFDNMANAIHHFKQNVGH